MAKSKNQNNPKLVPMVPVLCPICKGKGRVHNETINAPIKCRGCEGKGWVEVHLAEPVPAPKVKIVTVPATTTQPDIQTVPYKPQPWEVPYPQTFPDIQTYPKWDDGAGNYRVDINSKDAVYVGTLRGEEHNFSASNAVSYTDIPEKQELIKESASVLNVLP